MQHGSLASQPVSRMGLMCVTLQMSVLNAELPAGRRDGNGNNPAHFTDSSTRVVGALPAWPHSRAWGYYPSGGLGLVLLIVVVLLLMGRI